MGPFPRQVAALEGGKAELARQVAALQQQLEAALARGRQLEAALREEHHLVGELQAQVGGQLRGWGLLCSLAGWQVTGFM